MKFCSVGTVKTLREEEDSSALQYLFDAGSPKPTDLESMLSILPDARSIVYDKEGDSLKCSPLAGLLDSKYYLTYVNIPLFGIELQSTAGFPTVNKTPLDVFKMFCSTFSNWEAASSMLTTTKKSVLKRGTFGYGKIISNSPYRYTYLDSSLRTQMLLIPTKIADARKSATHKISLSAAQAFNGTESYTNYYGRWVYTKTRTSYLAQVRVSMNGNFGVLSSRIYAATAGSNDIPVTLGTQSGINLNSPMYEETYYNVNSEKITDWSYFQPEYQNNTALTTMESLLPSVDTVGIDETIDLSFGVTVLRRQNEFVCRISDFTNDLVQTGSKVPNTLPTVSLAKAWPVQQISPVISL